jgi:hypothetical protein
MGAGSEKRVDRSGAPGDHRLEQIAPRSRVEVLAV